MAGQASVVLFWGSDEFLLKLAAHELLDGRGLRATEVDAADWQGGETSDLATPSLWGEARALLASRCEALPEAGQRELIAYAKAPAPEALCVLTLVSGARTTPAFAKALQGAGGTVRQIAMKRGELGSWVAARARVRGLAMTGPAGAALVGTIGEDTASLDQAVEQLAAAFAGRTVGPEEVRTQFQGLGEQRVWDLCDQALSGRLPEAMVTLRGLLAAREDPLMILGVIAARVRDLVRVRSLPERLPAAEAARAVGLRFEWQVRRYRDQAVRFTQDELATLHGLVAQADRALKGGVPGDVMLPTLVAAMAGERDATLDVPIRVSR